MLILAGTCAAQVAEPAGTLPDGRQIQAAGQQPGGPPQGDRATLPSNPFPDDGPDVAPPQENAEPQAAPAPGAGQAAAGGQASPNHTEPNPAQPSQSAQPPASASGAQVQVQTHTHAPAEATAAPRRLPNSLLDHPAQPAQVTLNGGELAVRANNSSLTQILHRLAADSGMKIDGLGQDTRVFGSYGPGQPRDVLASLLDGANYNVLMVGATHDGAPRELILTPRGNAASAGPQPVAQANASESEDDGDDQSPEENAPPPFVAPPRMPVSPVQQQSPNGAVKTPAQILQELEQMRRQQQTQQGPQQ